MRNVTSSAPLQSIRTVSGRITLTDTLPRFAHFLAQETPSTVVFTDCSVYNGKIICVGTDSGYLTYTVLDPSLSSDTGSAFYNPSWTRFSTQVKVGSRPAIADNRLFYQKSDGTINYADWDGAAWGAETATGKSAILCSIAAIDTTHFFVMDQVSAATVTRFQISLQGSNGSVYSTFPGFAYSDTTDIPAVGGAICTDNVGISYYYLYFTSHGGKRTEMVAYRSSMWSEISPVVPLDIVDDTSLFTLSGVSTINSKVFITGILKRASGMDMHVYLQGPEEVLMGRELFIDDQQTDNPGGKLVLVDNTIWYIGANLRSSAAATTLFGVDNPSLAVQVAPEDSSLSAATNSPFDLQVNLPPSFNHEALRSGAEIKLEAKVGDDYIDMGRYNIDAVLHPQDGNGKELTLQCRSSAMKRLNQWRSDASYDYWSQAKLNCNPKDLAQVLRVSGTWKEKDGALSEEKLNVDGMLYLTAKASRGSECKAHFKQIVGDFKARFGVGINFYIESKYEAATRLGVDQDQVTEDQYGSSGLFAVYGPTEYSGASGIGLYWVNNGTWVSLANASVSFTAGTYYWMMIQAIEGHIRVFYRQDGATDWATIITHDFAQALYQPWKSEQMGRGSMYMRPITPYSQGYAFLSDQDIIPVDDNGSFPTSDVVLVDEEQIHYSGKSANTKVADLSFRYGDLTLTTAAPGTNELTFAYDRYHARIIQKFSLGADKYLRAIKVWARKVNYPKDSLDVSLWHGPTDGSIPLGTQVENSHIPSEKLAIDTYNWVVAEFDGTLINSQYENWIILDRGDNPTHPDSETYYACDVSNAGNSPAYYWDEQNDLWNQTSYSLPLEIYTSDSGPGQWFSIYVAPNGSLSTTNNAYVGEALVVTDGTGKGLCFKIVGYTYRSGQNGIFYVDRDPGTQLDESSVLAIVPTLKISKTSGALDRGYNNTIAASHSAVQVDVYRASPYIESDTVQFYSSEKDFSLEAVARTIGRKAGIASVSGAELLGSTVVPSAGSPVIAATNVIGEVAFPSGLTGTLSFIGRMPNPTTTGVEFRVDGSTLSYYSGATLVEKYTMEHSPSSPSELAFSLYGDAASFWLNDRFVHTFTLTSADAALTGTFFKISGTSTQTLTTHFPEANIRIDNFILDAGRAGDQLLSEQIGEKRFFYQDAADGSLRLFMGRTTVNTADTPYTLSVAEAEAETDSSLVTRVRLEGVEVAEKYDPDLIRNYGNIFYQSNCPEIYSTADADFYTGALLNDFGSRLITKEFSGAADPRIEPGDQVYVTVNGVSRLVIVDNINITLSMSQENALFDMDLIGRIPRSELAL